MKKKQKGFTLLETLFAAFLIGLAVVSIVIASETFTTVNGTGIDVSTAEFLIEEIKGLMAPLPLVDPETATAAFGPETGESSISDYDDLDDFDSLTISPPIDISVAVISGFSGFTQQITVQNVNASNLEQVAADHGSDFVRVTVAISKNGQQITTASWIRASK